MSAQKITLRPQKPNSLDLNPVDYTVWSVLGRSESRGYWTCCWRVASASMRLHSCWRRTFWVYAVVKMMWCDTCDFFWETITACHVCRYSVNHSNVHLIIVLAAESDTANFPSSASIYVRWSGHFRHSFVKGLFQDDPSNFYWNWFIFDRHGAKGKLAQFFFWDMV